MLCSVLIPTWRRASSLHETLQSLNNQSYRNFEVIVVCDGPDGATRSLAEELEISYSLRWVFHEQNRGLPSARNAAAHHARGEIVLPIDDDTPADPFLIANHIRHHATAPSRNLAVYGRIVEARCVTLERHTDRFLQQSWERALEQHQACIAMPGVRSVGSDFERSICFGLNCSIRRDVFIASGGFNSRLRWAAEEMEFGHRLYRLGIRFIFEPSAVVAHRNTKRLTEYYRRSWFLGGQVDVQRVFELGQRNPQTESLVSVHRGYLLNKAVSRFFWYGTPILKPISRFLERATNRSGSRCLFGAWARICRPTEYWSAVKSEERRLRDLKDAAGSAVSVLMFHSISAPQSKEEARYCINPKRFRRFMRLITITSHRSISSSEWLSGRLSGRNVLLTFDDGYEDLYTELAPVASIYGLKPLVFLVSDLLGSSNDWARGMARRKLLTLQQVREMQRHGFEFGSHTVTHPSLPYLNDRDLEAEVRDSKRCLEDLLGAEVNAFAYPFGDIDQRVRAAAAAAGYKLAFTTNPGANWWNDPLCLNRAEIGDDDSSLDFTMKLHTGYSVKQWLGARWGALENDLPTPMLRGAATHVRNGVRSLLAKPWGLGQ